jgi:small ligand-binding sensory domain FIST
MQAGVGYSGDASAEVAAARATRTALVRAGLARADLALVFATTEHRAAYGPMLEVVQEVSGAPSPVGCSGLGVLTSDGEFEGQPGVAVLVVASRRLRARTFLVPTTPSDSLSPGQTVRRLIDPLPDGPRLLVLLPDPFSTELPRLLSDVEEDPSILPIVGAAPSGGPGERRSFQWCGRDLAVQGVAGCLVTGEFALRLGVAQGCQPIGQPSRISRARGNQIAELDGRPALDHLRATIAALSSQDAARAVHSLFAGIAREEAEPPINQGDLLVRHLVGVDPASGVVAVSQEVRQGQIIQFVLRDAQAARADMRRMLESVYTATRRLHRRFGLYFNCLGRGIGLYGDAHHDLTIIKEYLGDVPLIGFFGNGELAPVGGRNYAHSYTGVLAIVAEG